MSQEGEQVFESSLPIFTKHSNSIGKGIAFSSCARKYKEKGKRKQNTSKVVTKCIKL